MLMKRDWSIHILATPSIRSHCRAILQHTSLTNSYTVSTRASAQVRSSTSIARHAPILHEYADTRDLLEASAELQHITGACLLVEDQFADLDALALMDTLRQRQIKLPIIVLTEQAQVTTAVEAMRKGAADVLEKPLESERLRFSLELALTGPITPVRNTQLAQHRLAQLSPRERQVLDLLCEGKLNKSIAHLLGISIKTVELHRSRVASKLQARCIQDMVRLSLGFE
jgi:two-component system response regulator FixJ